MVFSVGFAGPFRVGRGCSMGCRRKDRTTLRETSTSPRRDFDELSRVELGRTLSRTLLDGGTSGAGKSRSSAGEIASDVGGNFKNVSESEK